MRLIVGCLLGALALQLILPVGRVSAGFDFFKKNKKPEDAQVKELERAAAEAAAGKPERQAPAYEEEDDGDAEVEAPKSRKAQKLDSLLDSMKAIKDQAGKAAPSSAAAGKRATLDTIRDAHGEHARIQKEHEAASSVPKRPSYQANSEGSVQGRGRSRDRKRREEEEEKRRAAQAAAEADDDDDDEDDYYEDEDEEGKEAAEGGSGGGGGKAGQTDQKRSLADRFTNKKVRDQVSAKFVSTLPQKDAAGLKKPNLSFLKSPPVAKKPASGGEGLISGQIEKNKLITGAYWQSKLGKAYKVTKKGIKGTGAFISELPKHVERSMDTINAFLQLDSKGKILALIDEAAGDAHFVRKEFSQFTLSWSPIMEKALDYLGDQNLDKIKWNDKDELDHQRDALHSLAFGWEFMRLMIVWRENLLVAHEAFKVWLDSVKAEVEAKRLEMDESLVVQLRTTHAYMLLTAWMSIEKAAHEPRTKLDYLMEIEDDRPKNYESEYFRNIVVLQEMYDPTIEELDKERQQVVNSISESGVVVDNLKDVDEFFESFRSSLAQKEINNIDWEVPSELTDFMAKLEPQLKQSTLVYTKAFLKENGFWTK